MCGALLRYETRESSPLFTQSDLFISGEGGYHTYRIPALLTTGSGTLLAFCEGRKHGPGDAGYIDLLLRRSFDNGVTWGPVQLVASDPPHTVGNPAPVFDRETGIIWLLFCRNNGDGGEEKITAGKAPRTVWVTHSSDEGATWATPQEITGAVKRANWTWYATGPVHGIQLRSGRLLIPCDHMVGVHFDRRRDPYHSHVIYSDDHGETWRIGGIVPEGTNESVAVELEDGSVYINCRNYRGQKRRAYAISTDQGSTFGEFGWVDQLVEPVCQASMIRFTDRATHGKNRVLFSNPASTERERLTVRLSYDECRSWNDGKVLHAGPAAYSDLCITTNMEICCLYERGEERPYERLTLARFDLAWLTDGADTL